MKEYKNVDEYISNFPQDVQGILEKIRKTVREAAPEATERISYGIPTYTLRRNLVHFGAYPRHIGFYPGSVGISMFKDDLAGYKTSKGTVQFQLDEPIPYDLIKKITKACVEARTSSKE